MSFRSSLFRTVLKHAILEAVRTVRDRAEDLIRQLEEHASAWAGRLALKYALGTALAVGALASLTASAKDGLMAAGLPAWAAQLVLGVVMAAGALLLFKMKSTSAKKESDKEPGSRTYQLSIEFGTPNPDPPRRGRRASPKSSHYRVVRVKHLRKGWQVESGIDHRKKRLFDNKRLALKAAKAAARKASADVVVLGVGKKARKVVERKAIGAEHAA